MVQVNTPLGTQNIVMKHGVKEVCFHFPQMKRGPAIILIAPSAQPVLSLMAHRLQRTAISPFGFYYFLKYQTIEFIGFNSNLGLLLVLP